MTPELSCLSANFDLIAESIRNSIRGAAVAQSGGALQTGLPVRGDLSTVKPSSAEITEFKPEAALHLEAHDTFLDNAFGRCNEF